MSNIVKGIVIENMSINISFYRIFDDFKQDHRMNN